MEKTGGGVGGVAETKRRRVKRWKMNSIRIGSTNQLFLVWHSIYCPRLVCSSNVTRVLAPGQVQLLANNAYLNSSSHTTCSANLTCNLCSGLQTRRIHIIIAIALVHIIHPVRLSVCLYYGVYEFSRRKFSSLPHNLLITSPENLHILWHVGGEILHCPRS